MAEEDTEYDLGPVDGGVIEAYPTGMGPDDSIEAVSVDSVRVEHPHTGAILTCSVVIELPTPDNPPTLRSVQAYLADFESVSVTPEGMAQVIREDLSEALNVDDVAVTVEYGNSVGSKQINAGRPV